MATTIDAAWLASATPTNGIRYGVNGPWGLNLANETFNLATNVVADGTAFLVKKAGVTLDLNGFTITFGNGSQPALLNSYFSDNAIVPGLPDHWDVSGASTASVVALSSATLNEINGFAGWAINCLKLDTMSTAQVLKSETFTLPTADIEYCASVFAKAHGNAFSAGLNIRIQIIDSVTGTDLARTAPSLGNPWTNAVGLGSGYGEPYYFVPSTVANPVYLQITVTPPTGLSTTVYLSRAEVKTSRNHGVVATNGFSVGTRTSGDLSSVGLLPYQLWAQYSQQIGPTTIKDTAGTGNFICGQETPGSSALWIRSQTTTITGIHATSSGLDAMTFDCANGTPTITGCTITDSGTAVSNRQRQKPAINLDSCGLAMVSGNTLTGCKHTGIFCTSPAAGASLDNNTISLNSRYTDGYGIVAADCDVGIEIHDNTITSGTTGRGILIDQYGDPDNDIHIFDNYVDVYEKPNIEYLANGLETAACRIRFGHGADNALRLRVYGNTLIARTDANGGHAAIALNVSFTTHTDPHDAWFYNNHCQAYNDNVLSTTNSNLTSTFYAVACAVQSCPTGGLYYFDNIFESNLIGLQLGGTDAGVGIDNLVFFHNNTIKRNTTDGYQGAGFLPIHLGTAGLSVRNIDLIGFTFDGAAPTDYSSNATWGNYASSLKEADVGWLIDVAVTNAVTGFPIAGATVVVKNAALVTDDTQTTDVGGLTTVEAITDNWSQPGLNPARTHLVYSPHTLSVSATGYTSQTISLGTLAANTSRSFALSPVGPPPNLAGFQGLGDFTGYSIGSSPLQALAGMQDILDFVGYRTGAVGEVAIGGFYGCFDFVGYGSGIPPIPPAIFLLGNVQRNVLITSNAQRSIKLTGEGRVNG